MGKGWGEITVEDILAPTGGFCAAGDQQIVLTGVSSDSRKIRAGQIFWALRGDRYNGHDFVVSALEQQAAGAIVERQ